MNVDSYHLTTVFRVAPACLRRGVEASVLEGGTDAGRIGMRGVFDHSKICCDCPVASVFATSQRRVRSAI